jgi:hypothetical protein
MNKNNYSMRTRLLRLKGWLFTGLILGLFASDVIGQAQTLIDQYRFSSSAGTYTAITGGTVYQSGATVNTDGVSTAITIPSFTYNGTAYTTMYISNNGFVTLGATAPTTATTNPIFATTAYGGAIAGYATNLVQSTVSGAAAEIRHIDDTGNSEYVIQYKDMARSASPTADRFNFQIRLNYSTGRIQIVYGLFTTTSTASTAASLAQVGLRGLANTDWFNRVVNGIAPYNTWATSAGPGNNVTTQSTSSSCRATSTIAPASGLTYTFARNTTTNYPGMYASLPYSQNFEGAWTTRNSLQDTPDAFTSIFPAVGNNSVRRNTETTTNSLWTGGGTSAVLGTAQGSGSARAHLYNAPGASSGLYDIFVDMSGAGSKTLAFDRWFNGTGGGTVRISLSTDGGLTFGAETSYGTTSGVWTATTHVLGTTTSSTCVVRFRFVSDFGNFNYDIDNVQIGVVCSGAPTAGAPAGVVPSSACSNGTFAMNLGSGYSNSIGISYQWQNATASASGPFANISGATSPTYVASNIDVTTYYQCIVTCSNSGLSDTSDVVTGTISTSPILITPGVSNFCGTGSSTTLTASSPTSYSYTWASIESGTLDSSPTANPANVTVSTTSAFSVTGFDSGSGCTRIAYYSVGVYPFPSSTMTVDADTICIGGSVNIGSGLSAASFSSAAITHAPLVAPVSAKNLVSAGSLVAPNGIAQTSGTLDDGGWGAIPIGFNFNFFGTSYNTCNVGTNGTIMFGTYNGAGLADFTFTTLPSVSEPLGMVAALAMDNDLSGATGGTLRYWTEGYAPNRKFVVSYEAVKEFGDAKFSTAQAIFFETLGTVEVHVTSSTNQDRVKLVGINGPLGDIGALAFNSGTAAAANNPIVTSFAYRFTPPANYNTVWSGDGVAAPLTGTNLFTKAATPTAVGTQTYSLVYTNLVTTCSNSATPGTVTVEVINPPTAPSVTSPINITGVQNVTITPTYAGTDVIRYWSALTGGTLLGTGASLTLPYVSASTAVYVETWNGGCNSGSRLLVDIQYTAPTCASIPVGSIAVSNITFANASLAWTNPTVVPASGYEYAVTTSATPPASGTASATNSATATGLSPATVYYVHVRGNCGAGDFSTWITSASFTTASVVAPPYATGFDPIPTGWIVSGFGVSTATTPAAGNPGAGARMNLWSSATTGFIRSAYVGTLVGTENLSFDFSLADYDSPYAPPAAGSGNFVVAISTDAGLNYTTLETVANDGTAGWQFRTYPLAAYAGQTVTVRLTGNRTSGDYYLAFDNFEIATPPPCPKPYAISATNPTINSIQINGTAPNATNGITIEYSTDNFTTTSYAYAASLPYTVTGLAGQTIYQFRLQSDCDVDGVSLISNTGSFTTLPCLPTYTTGKTVGDLLSRVEILGTTLSNNSGLAETNPAYTFFSTGASNTADLVAGTQYTVEASIGTWGNQGIAAWVDYDDDGLFEASEKIGNTIGTIGSGFGLPGDELLPDHTTTFEISLACNPVPGVHRMRVRGVYAENGEDIDPCANYGWGECEDYNVTILPPPPCPIVPSMTISSVVSNSALATWPVGCAEGQWDLAIMTTAGTPTVTHPDVTVNSNYAITGLTPSTTYYAYVQADCIGDGNSSWTGPYVFATLAPPPANDECAAAVGLPVNAGLSCTLNGTGNLTGATASAGPVAACGDFGDDVWYSFVATNATHIVTISDVTPFTTLSFQVLSGTCGSLTALNCNNTTAAVTGLTPGVTYRIRVASNGSVASTSTFNICLTTPPPPPANDDYCNATTLAVGNGCTTTIGSVVSATLSGVPNGTCYSFGSSNFDVWYKFVAPLAVPANTASVIINTQLLTGGVTDGLMQLYSATGTCPGALTFTQIACDDDSGPGLLPSITATGLNSGETYYVRVHQYGAGSIGSDVANANYGKFGICIVNAGAPVPANDNIASAILVSGNNAWYPQCYNYSGDCTLSSNSSQSAGAGPDNWYRFTAASTAVSIDMTSTGLDNAISLVTETSPGVYTVLSSEDANFAVGGLERLNYDGLTINQTYYVSFGASFGTTGGAFQGCIRQLLRSSCNTNVASPIGNCSTFKATWTGANTYSYQFSPTGGSIGGGSVNATGPISLSNPSLGLVPGNTYNVIINATYSLTNGVGTSETITVFGSNPSCANVQIAAHSSVEVRNTQRCDAPATLLRSSFLRTDPFVCGVTNYTFEFTPVVGCDNDTQTGLTFTYPSNSRIITLNFNGTTTTPINQTIQNQTYYKVRVRPNFGVAGVNQGQWGNPRTIFIGGSVLEVAEELNNMAAEADRMDEESMMDAMVYPNPSNGEVVNLNVANVSSENVFVRIMDTTGRLVYSNRYTVDGSLNTVVSFAQPLANGLYTVEFIMDNEKLTEKMMIQK